MKTTSASAGIATLIGFAVLAIAPLGVGIGLLTLRAHVQRTRAAAADWHETACRVETCAFERTDDGRHLDFSYRYSVDGREFVGDQLDVVPGRFGDDDVFEEAIYESFPAGADAVCYVDPADPARAVFDREHGTDAPRRLFLLSFPFLGTGLLLGSLFTAGLLLPDRQPVAPDSDPAATPGADVFRTQAPPRPVGLAERVVVFAGPLGSQLAWFFLVGFVFVFVVLDGPAAWGRLFGSTSGSVRVSGTVIDTRKIDSYEFEIPVYMTRVAYDFAGATHTVAAYTRGQRHRPDEQVEVVVDPDRPARGVVAGTRPSEFSWWHSAIPLGVVALLAFGLGAMYLHGLRTVWLLRHGACATARLLSHGESDEHDLHGDGMRSGHAFDVDGVRYRARLYGPGRSLRRREQVDLLYDPRRPGRNRVLTGPLDDVLAAAGSVGGVLAMVAAAPLALLAMYVLLRGAELL